MELFELFAKMGLDTKDFEENIKQSSDKGKSFGAAFGEVAADIGRAALEIGKAAAGMAVEIGKAAFAVGADFEAEMTNLQAITGMTADEMNMMGDGIRNIALETGKSVIEVAANAKMVAEAGGDMNLMMSQLEHGTNLAMASQTDLATTLDFLGSSMKTFGVEAEDTQGVVDSFALVTSLANTTLSDLSYAYTNAGGEASNAGLSIDDVNAILITFANAGLKGGAAGTSLNAVLRNLSTPTDKAAGALDDLNVALYDTEGATRDVFDVMSDLESALSGLTDEEKNQYESVIFDTVALKGWNMIASEGIDAIAELSGELSDSAEAFDGLGQAAGMAGVATDNFKGTVDHFNAALADAGISIFENFKGPIEAVIESATGIVTAFAGIVTGVDGAKDDLQSAVSGMISVFVDYLPKFLEAGVTIITELVVGIARAIPSLIAAVAEIAPNIISTIASGLGDMVPILKPITNLISTLANNFDIVLLAVTPVIAAIVTYKTIMAGVEVVTKLAAAAQGLLNAAMSANVIGLVVAGVAGLVAGIAGLVMWLNRETESEKALKKELEAVTAAREAQVQAMNDSAANQNEKIAAIKSETSVNRELVKQIEDLYHKYWRNADIEKMTAEEKQRLASMVDLLNDSMGETVMMYDAENHELVDLTGNVNDLINARERELEVAARRERILDLMKEEDVLQGQLAAAIERRKVLIAEGADKESENYKKLVEQIDGYNDLLAINANNLERNKTIIDEYAAKAVEAEEKAAEAAKKAAQAQIDAMDEVEKTMFTANKEQERIVAERTARETAYTDALTIEANKRMMALDEFTQFVGDASLEEIQAMDDVLSHAIDVRIEQERIADERKKEQEALTLVMTEEANKQGLTLDEYLNQLKETEKREKDEYEKRKKTLESYTNAATDMFKKIETKSKVSVAQMTANLEHNQKVIQDWSQNLAYLASKDIDEGFLEKLREAGPESAGIVYELVEASDTQLQKLSSVFANGSEVATSALLQQLGLPEVTNSGSDMVDNIAAGVRGNDNLNIAAQSLVVEASAVIAAETDKADYPGVGMNIVQGIIDGVTSKSSDLYNTMVNLAQNTLQAMQDALEIASPSAAFRDKVGGNIAEGVADGINKKADKAAKAAKNLAKQSYDAAVLWIKDYRNSADYLLAEEARMWDELAQQYAKGSKQRIDAETEARKVREKMQKEESKAQKDAAKEAQNLLKEREKAQKEAAKAAADALKAQEKAQKEFYDNAKLQIADYQNGVDYSIAEEIKMWESLGENYREVSKEKVEVDKTINKLREDLRKEEEAAVKKYNEETFNNSKIWIDMQKSLNMLSAQEEIEAWERVSERYEEGTKQREEADKNLAKARQDLRDAEKKAISEMEKLEENYQKSLEDRSKALFDTFKLFGEVSLQETNIDKNKKAFENSQKTYDNLTNSMGDLEDKATKAASALNKALGKIDKDAKVAAAALQETIAAVSGEMNSAENLTDKKRSDLLKKQADAQKKYDKTMETLREKRSDAEAKYSEEMETIGAKQIDTLEKLIEAQEKLTAATEETQKSQAQITSENLAAQIAEMAKWGDNMKKLAGKGLDEGFLAELRKMGPSANSYLDELLNSSDDDLNKLSELYQEKYRLAKDLAVDELEELRLETNDKIGVLLDELQKTMSSETNPIGVNMIQGIIEGLNESSGALYNTLTSIMLSSVEVAQSVLQISSPSRVFERIGSFTGEGFIEGIKGMASKVQSVVSKVFGGFDVADIQTDLHMDRNISDFSAVSEFSGGANESLLRELIDSQDELTDAIRGNKPQNGQSSPVIELDGNVLGRVFEPIMERQNNLRGNRMSRTAVRT